jgi:ribose transport system permease protein
VTTSEGSADAGVAPGDPRPLTDVPEEKRDLGAFLRDIAYRYSLVFVLLLFIVVFSILLPRLFPTMATLRTVMATQSVLMIVALGLTFPLAAGEFDLSFGGVLGLSSTLVAVLTVEQGWPLWAAVLGCLGMGVFIGLLNATIVVRLGVNSLITTLGVGSVLLGLSLFIANNQVIAGSRNFLFDVTTGTFLGLPYPVYFALGVAVLAWYVQDHTPFGRYIYFTGEGRETARLSGISVDRVRVTCFAIASFAAAVAGIVNFGRLGSADPNIGTNYLLPGFATVFLGATAIHPGRYNAWGTVLAVYVLVVGIVGLQLLGGAGYLEPIFNGLALVLAVAFSVTIRRSLSGERTSR